MKYTPEDMEPLSKEEAEWRLERVSGIPVERIQLAGVKEAIRKASPRPKRKEPCFICGQHQWIAHSHHLVEVGRVAEVLRGAFIFDWVPQIPAVFLCPNHHAYWHELNRRGIGDEYVKRYLKELDADEFDKLERLIELRDEAKSHVWPEVRRRVEEVLASRPTPR